jgi:5-methylcytosine-specific restriction endonuclease McrA
MICEKCYTRQASERHHKLSQTKLNKKLYGDLIHDPKNIQLLCYDCHHNKPLDKLSEIEFCIMMDIEPRSTSGKMTWERIKTNQ